MPAFTQIGVEAIVKNFGKFNKDLTAMNTAIAKSGTASDQAAKATSRYNATLSSMAAGGLDMVLRALVAFGKSAIEEGAAFQKAMSNVKAISGATAAEFAKLEDQASGLGATTKFTAIEAAEGMSFLAMAGFETTEIIAAMPGTLSLAAAANLDLGTSADIVSNILTGFGASAESTGQYVDVLTKTFTTSNTNLVQLGQAMKFAGPVAASLGVSVEDAAAAVGTLSNAGIQGSLAGTTLRGIMMSLAKPTKAAQLVMDELGISVFDASGNMLPFYEVIGQVERATAGMTQEQKAATLNTLVGMKRMAGFNILLQAGEGNLKAYGDELRNSMGTASEIASKQLDNLSGDFTLFQSAVSGFKIGAFELFEPTLRSTTQAATEFVLALGEGAKSWSWMLDVVSGLNEQTNSWAGTVTMVKAFNETTKGTLGILNPLAGVIAALPVELDAQNTATAEAIDLFYDYGEAAQEAAVATEEVGIVTQVIDQQTKDYGATMKTFAADFAESTKTMTEEAIESARVQREMLAELRLSTAEYYNSMREYQEDAAQSEMDFNAEMSGIRSDAAAEQKEAQQSLAEELVDIETQREEKLAWVLSGAHARTQEENAAALSYWNTHFDELKTTAEQKTAERTDAIIAEQQRAESAAAAAREKEKAEMAAHLDELKLQTSLAMLETTGELARLTGLVGISAADAAELITAGVLPVTQEMAQAIQGTMVGMEQSMAAATETATANQEILKAAMAGTLLETTNLGLGIGAIGADQGIPTVTGNAMAMGQAFTDAKLPLEEISTSTLPAITDEVAGPLTETWALFWAGLTETTNVYNLGPQATHIALIQQVYTVEIPNWKQVFTDAANTIIALQQEINALFEEMISLLNQVAAAAQQAADAMGKIGDAKSEVEKLKDAVDDLISKLNELIAKAGQAGDALSKGLGRAAEGLGLRYGIGLERGLGLQAGLGGRRSNTGNMFDLGYRVPFGYPNDSFGPFYVETGEEMLITPRGTTIEQVFLDRLAGLIETGGRTDNRQFNMTVNTIASPRAVVEQFEIMRSLAD